MRPSRSGAKAIARRGANVACARDIVAVNIRAAFIGLQAAAGKMKDGGRIIVIGSNTAIRTAFPGASIYSMTKAALTGLVRGAAIDLAPRAITVNNVQPGPTATGMTSAVPRWLSRSSL